MRGWVMALALSLAACAVQAQMIEIDPVDNSVLACLEKHGPAPTYPPHDEETRLSGRVRVSIKFAAPDREPEVDVLFRAASDAMVNEVSWFVRGYRVPCIAVGAAPLMLIQEFEFKPRATEPITWTEPRAARQSSSAGKQAAKPSVAACTLTPKGGPGYVPTFKEASNVIVNLRFTAPDAPPEVRLVYSSASSTQVKIVTDYVQQYRLPCQETGAKPVVVQQQFFFGREDAEQRTFKDEVSLVTFLSSIKGIQAMRARFDLNTMSCPFKLAWKLGKPALENDVGEVGKSDLNRTEFLAWLAGLEMALTDREFEKLLGRTLIISVPCGVIDLEPRA